MNTSISDSNTINTPVVRELVPNKPSAPETNQWREDLELDQYVLSSSETEDTGATEYYDNLPKLRGTYTKKFWNPGSRTSLIEKISPWRIIRTWEYVHAKSAKRVFAVKYAKDSASNWILLKDAD